MEYEILVTEHRSFDHTEWFANNVVRVFVDGDYSYGYWVPEDKLYELFDEAQRKQYREDHSSSGGKFMMGKEAAQHIIDIGQTPYNKMKLR